jgi:branched-chain amino acid transport system substrate-binding protein
VFRFTIRSLRHRTLLVAIATGLILAATYAAAFAATSATKSPTARNAPCDTSAHDPGVSSSQVTVGETLPLTTAGPTPAQTVAGSQAYYDMINKAGGVKGHKIKLIARDDQYTPSVALQQMRDLIQRDRVFLIAGGQGTPNFLAEAAFVNSQKIPAIAPYAPSSVLGNMKNPYVYMTAVDYTTEFQVMTKFIIQKYHPKSLSLVGVQGNVGDDSKLGMQKAMGAKKIPLQYIPEQPGTSDYTPIATQLKSNGADWVFLIITPSDTGGLLQAMKRVGYKPRLAGWAGMGDQTYINQFGNLSQNTVVAQELALASSPDPLVKKYVRDFKAQTGKTPTGFNNALGWVQAQVTVKALQTAPALTRSCVLYALNRIKNFKTGILPPITFGPNIRQGVDAVGLVQIVGKGVKSIAPFRSVSS